MYNNRKKIEPKYFIKGMYNNRKKIEPKYFINLASFMGNHVYTGFKYARFRFPSPILRVQFNPRNASELLVVPMRHAAVVINLEGGHKLVPVEDESDLTIFACYDRKSSNFICFIANHYIGKTFLIIYFALSEHLIHTSCSGKDYGTPSAYISTYAAEKETFTRKRALLNNFH